MEVRGGFPKCGILPWTPLYPPCLGCTDVPRCSIHLSSWGEKRADLPLLLWVARGIIREFMDWSNPLKVGLEMQKWRSFLQFPCAKPGGATEPWAAGWGNEKAFLNAWVWCISGGIKPNSPLLVDLEYNSTCLNGDGFQIYSGAGEKREKIMHRVGGSWEEPPPSFLFYQSFQWGIVETAASSLPMQIETN